MFQSAFMNTQDQHLNALKDIKQMMERSSRFISLSGLSGIAAGICALVGAWFANNIIHSNYATTSSLRNVNDEFYSHQEVSVKTYMGNSLFQIAIATLIAAFILSFLFTYLRSKKTNTPIWGKSSKRLLVNVLLPMIVGGIYLLKLIEYRNYGLIAPGCLIFYGLALLNASKYTLIEIRYLGIAQIVLGIINLWFVGKGLYFWAAGFGILHIVYGIVMWFKYERNQ